MALVEFSDLPNTTTPVTASNLNNNFNELKAYSLYSSAGSNSTITLSDSAANYSFIEVYGSTNNIFVSQKIKNPNNKTFAINLNYTDSTQMIFLLNTYSVSGTTITPVTTNKGYSVITNNATCNFHSDTNNYFYITDVIGYK